MIGRILGLLGGAAPGPSPERLDELQIAVAALLVEAARMDDRFEASERATIQRLLGERFALAPEAARDLLAAAERAAQRSSQLFPFTRLVVDRLDPPERVRLIEMLWEVAYADGALAPDEDALLRRVAGLVHVPDQERGAARQRVLRRLGRCSDCD